MHFETKGDFIVATPTGRIDSSNAHIFNSELDEIIATNNSLHLILDFGGIEYISSAGLRVLLVINKKQSEGSKRFIIASMNQNVQKVFESSGFSKVLTISPNVGEAMKL